MKKNLKKNMIIYSILLITVLISSCSTISYFFGSRIFDDNIERELVLNSNKKKNLSEVQKDPIFTYLVSEIGESRDIYRFDIEQDDLKEAVNLYNSFKGNKKYFP